MGTRQFRRGRLFAVFACLSLIGPFIAVQVVTSQVAAAAATASVSIGIDNTTPSPCVSAPVGTLPPVCHNWTYDDYFPNGVTTPTITVHSGDVVAFNMSTGSPDALHTVTLLQPTETVTEALAAYPLAVPDTNPAEPAGQLELNPAVLSPTNPACGSSAANACPYDGSAHVNSGALSPGAPPVYFQINAPAGTTVPFMCLIHPGMVGQLTVVTSTATASTQADLDTQATALYQTETAEAFAQESALTTAGAGHTTNPNGTTAWSVWAGANGLAAGGAPDPHVQLLEMLPSALTIKPGDTVTWASTSLLEPHTITFPHSEATIGSAYDFAPQLCAGPTGPTPATGPPPFFGCAGPPGSPSGFEVHLNPGPLGPTSITTPGTQATSGVIASFSLGGPVVSQTSFTFPASNAISYECTVHDHMYGAIYVAGAPGYRELAADGGVFAQGSSSFAGSTGSLKLNKPIVGGASTPDGKGYWAVGSDGGVFAFGDAGFFGSAGSIKLNKPIVGMAATPDGQGYWLFASDGGVFNYGDAGFFGSAGSITLNKPIVGGVASPDGLGYLMVATDGGVFNYGNAGFYGSAGSIMLNKPIVGIARTPSGGGYVLAASDGGVFTYGNAGFYGSAGSLNLNKPIVGIQPSVDGLGYLMVASDGGVFTYGDASFAGSEGGTTLNSPIVGVM